MAHPMVVTKSPKSVTALHKSEAELSDFSTQDLYRELLARFHEDPDRDGPCHVHLGGDRWRGTGHLRRDRHRRQREL